MNKFVVAGFSLVAVCLLVLCSQTNVVGYQTVQTSQQNLIKERINQKKLTIQTIVDLVNNKDIQDIFFTSQMKDGGFFNPDTRFSSVYTHTLTKNQLKQMYVVGVMLSKAFSKSKIHSMAGHFKDGNLELQKKINSAIEKDTRLKEEITQLYGLNCHCKKESYDKTTLCNLLFVIVYGSLFLSLITMGIFLIFVYIGIYIADNILNCNWFPFYPP